MKKIILALLLLTVTCGWIGSPYRAVPSLDDATGTIKAFSKTLFYGYTDVTGTAGNGVWDALATISLPGNSIGANGIVKIYALFTATEDGANDETKTTRVVFGGVNMGSTSMANGDVGNAIETIIMNKGATNSQITLWSYAPGWGTIAGVASAPQTASIDTTAAVTITIEGKVGDQAGDDIILNAYWVEVTYIP